MTDPNPIPEASVVAGDPMAAYFVGVVYITGELHVTQTIVTPGITVNGGIGTQLLNLGVTPTTVGIVGGMVNVANKTRFNVVCESGTSDQLDRMEGATSGQLVEIRPAVAGTTITIKHNAGVPRDIWTKDRNDIVLSNVRDARLFILDGNNWSEV